MRMPLVIFLVSAMTAGVAHAQADIPMLSQDEIAERFQRQKTRGLVIAPVSQGEAQQPEAGAVVELPPVAQGAAQQPATGTAEIAPVAQTGAQQPQAAPAVEYAQVADEDAVNIRIVFDFDSAALRADQKPQLASMCGAMNQVDVEVFRIVGHTDAAGSDEYNERLSRLRAEEVKRHLVSECGIAPERLEAVGMGKRALYDPENPRADVNRRVEFQVVS